MCPPRVHCLLGEAAGARQGRVEAGAPLLALVGGAPGQPGMTVTGQLRPAPESPTLDLGRYVGPGTALAPGGQLIVATTAGLATFDGRQVRVETLPSTGTERAAADAAT